MFGKMVFWEVYDGHKFNFILKFNYHWYYHSNILYTPLHDNHVKHVMFFPTFPIFLFLSTFHILCKYLVPHISYECNQTVFDHVQYVKKYTLVFKLLSQTTGYTFFQNYKSRSKLKVTYSIFVSAFLNLISGHFIVNESVNT